jgi:hypothetical protein
VGVTSAKNGLIRNSRKKTKFVPMKLFKIFFLFLLLSCSEDDNGPQMGCSIGTRDGRVHLLRCATFDEYIAGNNIERGGISYFGNYSNHQWVKVKDCKECEKYR